MKKVAEPEEFQHLMQAANDPVTGSRVKSAHPGVFVAANQLAEDYDFSGVQLVPPTTLFDDRMEIILDNLEVHILHVGSCHQVGDTIVWVSKERVLFTGDVLFRLCTPMGWVGTYDGGNRHAYITTGPGAPFPR